MPWAASMVAACSLPFLLNLCGFDFAAGKGAYGPGNELAAAGIDAVYQQLGGAFWHTILEWSAFCAAIFTVVLAFVHFKIKRDVVTPIIGVALFCAGCMDAFHTLAADRLIESKADVQNLVPFTWALCRVFNALIMILGIVMDTKKQGSFSLVLAVSLLFVASACTEEGNSRARAWAWPYAARLSTAMADQ